MCRSHTTSVCCQAPLRSYLAHVLCHKREVTFDRANNGGFPVLLSQNPLYSIIRDQTQTAASADAQFEARVKHFQEKKLEKSIVRINVTELKNSELQKRAQVATAQAQEPYFVATSTGLGTGAARANSIDAGLAFYQKVKDGQK